MIVDYVSRATLTDWILCLIVFILIIWKVWPNMWEKIKKTFNTARYGADLVDMVNEHQTQIHGEGGINDKLQRDYERLNKLEVRSKASTEENELIMKSLLAILKVMGNMEESEDTSQIQEEIIIFMNKQSHKN